MARTGKSAKTALEREQDLRRGLLDSGHALNVLESVMGATKLATLFLDAELRVRGYTASLGELLGITAKDLEQPVAHLKRRLHYEEIEADARQARDAQRTVERAIMAKGGKALVARCVPYHAQGDETEGVAITFMQRARINRTAPSVQERGEGLETRRRSRSRQWEAASRRLIQAQEMFQALFQANPVPTVLSTLGEDLIISANPAFLRCLGLQREDVIGHTTRELQLGRNLSHEECAWLVEEARKKGGLQNQERELELPSGKMITVLGSLEVLKFDNAEVLLWTFIDITERKRTEAMIREMLDAAPDPTVVIDPNGDIVFVNRQVERVFGYARDHLIGRTVRTLMPERFHGAHPEHRIEYFREPRTRHMGGGKRIYGLKSDGTEFPVEITLSPLQTPDGLLGIAAVRDVTERVEAERSIRDLATRLTEAEQMERGRISQILHDDLQQQLYAIKAQLLMMRDDPEQQDRSELEAASAKVDQWLAEAISLTRNLSVDLSPVILQGEGLAAALSWLCKRVKDQYALKVALTANGPEPQVDGSLRVVLVGTVRELLFNIVKHAGTSQAAITVENLDGRVDIMISDEGKGFDAAEVMKTPGTGHGLADLQQRLELMGCHMQVESEPGAGTRVMIRCPGSAEAKS